MGAPPALSNLDIGELCGAAGGNPWKLDDELQAGDPQAINKLADAFHQAGNRVKEADDDFDKAKQKFNAAYTRNQGEHPINESAEVQQATTALAGHKEALPRIAASLEQTAASLATAQRQSDSALGQADSALHEIDNQMSVAKANDQDTGALHDQAVGVVKSALGQVNSARSNYVTDLHAAETAMSGAGYVPESLGNLDAMPGDDAAKAAAQYDKSGQRARDQAMVDKAKAEGRTHYIANDAGLPGNMTAEEAAAAQRLKDYAAITDPNSRFGPGYNPHEVAQARRLAGERLGDYNTSKVMGPLPTDTVLGGDARTRAQARLKLQQALEQGQVAGHPQFMTADEATRLMDQWEAEGRQQVLGKLTSQLEAAGMSHTGAAEMADAIQHGAVPSELVRDAAKGIAAPVGAFGEGLKADAEALHGGRHWGAAPAFSEADAKVLKNLGSKIGLAGTAVDAAVAIYDWQHGESLVEAGGKFAGRTGGAMLGGWAAGALWGSFVGPEGTLIVGFLGAMAGGIGGDKAVEWMLGH
ncbi:putative alpha/beta hydrolase [Mycobacterium branderi]|uniref:Predicted hydrolase N-terminal domain-containing protein n=1 Tax=Mycobacterium branderi TaxID=43348 RepID=A0A7I7VZF8_9MYCO|nr:hypothetical protein [Mycobacterium branderi]MCV7233235.1 hypothetical protein [Mycobacterium branderi]ORA41308.1 hypothetical protein BST20_04140 [Mycobacterium branderi]BBZ10350.1 hypothetical protein MBRA_05450 [Mycobacterium branderi]